MRRTIATLIVAMLSLLPQAAAQTWPTQTIKWVVPYPPGGNTDVIARAIADKISPALGQPIVIENRGGANTITGTNVVAKADDGHTIGLIVDSHSINAAFGGALPGRPNGFYHDKWWIWDAEQGVYSGYGINGQQLLVHRPGNLVVAKFSTWPDRWSDRWSALSDSCTRALVDHLTADA